MMKRFVLNLANWFWNLFMMPRNIIVGGAKCTLRFNKGRQISGKGNKIEIGNGSCLMKCQFVIKGNNNK